MAELDRDAVFRKLRMKQDNKMCFDCNSRNPTWASVPYGVYICLGCAGTHRSLGVHISFVRSTTLDTWTQEQLGLMIHGGNQRARQYFKHHGWTDMGAEKIEAKYTSRAATLYRQLLAKEIQDPHGDLGSPTVSPMSSFSRSASGKYNRKHADNDSFFDEHALVKGDKSPAAAAAPAAAKPAAPPKPAPAPAAAAASASAATSPPAAPKIIRPSSAAMGKKPIIGKKHGASKAGKGGGLGVKKLGTKVDTSLFDQKPMEAPPPPPPGQEGGAGAEGGGASAPGVATASRFAYDQLTESKAESDVQKDKSGHIAIDSSGQDDFFSDFGGSSGRKAAGAGRAPAPNHAEDPNLTAQKKFAGAKAISSSQYHGVNGEDDNKYEREARLSRFGGSAAISSADYFEQGEGGGGRGGGGGGGSGSDFDVTASELIGKISMQAKQDAAVLKNIAQSGARKLTGMASSFMSDLSGRY